ncbi:MAG: hypothetical protein LUH21_04820 [Clostridiales bacterium]|nr:hypothetical protein [Clostridiales bacterium]
MEANELAKYESASKFFYKEIKQMRLQLGGILSTEYREYISRKLDYYELVTYLIGKELYHEIDQ